MLGTGGGVVDAHLATLGRINHVAPCYRRQSRHWTFELRELIARAGHHRGGRRGVEDSQATAVGGLVKAGRSPTERRVDGRDEQFALVQHHFVVVTLADRDPRLGNRQARGVHNVKPAAGRAAAGHIQIAAVEQTYGRCGYGNAACDGAGGHVQGLDHRRAAAAFRPAAHDEGAVVAVKDSPYGTVETAYDLGRVIDRVDD